MTRARLVALVVPSILLLICAVVCTYMNLVFAVNFSRDQNNAWISGVFIGVCTGALLLVVVVVSACFAVVVVVIAVLSSLLLLGFLLGKWCQYLLVINSLLSR